MNILRRKKHKKMTCLLVSSDRSIEKLSLPVTDNYLVDERLGKAWGLAPNSLIPYKGKSCQLIVDRNCSPIGLNGDRWQVDNFNGIVATAYDMETHRAKKDAREDKQRQMAFTGILILCVCVLVLVLAGLLQSGSLHLPSFG